MGRLLTKAAILSAVVLCIWLSGGVPARANQAPVKYVNGAGIGNLLGTERGYAYVGWGALRSSWQTAAQNAVADWRSRTQAAVGKDGVNLAPNGASVQIDVVETGYSSIFDGQYGNTCGSELANHGGYYAWTDALTINHTGVSDSNGNGWWDPSELTKPFGIVRICLNAGMANDSGTIAHEIGHALGVNHPIYNGGSCPDQTLNTIMAYNYGSWSYLWPPWDPVALRYEPTSADVVGPWVCNTGNAAGTNWVYDFNTVTGVAAAPAYFVSASSSAAGVVRACFYDGSSAETAYFVKAFPSNGGPAQGNFAPNDPSWNNYICRDVTVSHGQWYHIAVYSYTSRTGQFSVPADSINTYWIWVG